MPPGFRLLIAAQFASALADNSLLIVGIALLAEQGHPPWWAPMLKFGFTLAYVLLAPGLGPLADAVPKARLMAWMNGVKLMGAVALVAGLHPALAFALIGLGAAAYAPAKYGLITEIVPSSRLVVANGWIEVTVVGAALLGTVLGGALVSAGLVASVPAETLSAWLASATDGTHRTAYAASLAVVIALYLLASALNLGVPDSGARYPRSATAPTALCRDYMHAHRTLWRDPEGGLSLAATTVVWGAGATLQFVVLRWATEVLGLSLERAAYLQAVVAIGVVAGAVAAGRFVPLHRARRMLPLGIVLGLLIPLMARVDSVMLALPLLALAGAAGGLLIVPMNALLQHRGVTVLSAGRSIAVQGFNENASVLAMLGVYGLLVGWEVPIVPLMTGFGLLVAAALAWLTWRGTRTVTPPAAGDPASP
jgi:MFS family permease